MKVTGKKNEFLKFVPSTQSNGSKKRIQLLRDDTYNCGVSHPLQALCGKRTLPEIRQRKAC